MARDCSYVNRMVCAAMMLVLTAALTAGAPSAYSAKEQPAGVTEEWQDNALVQAFLICGLEAHTHEDSCYSEVVTGTERDLICGYEEGERLSVYGAEEDFPEKPEEETEDIMEDPYINLEADMPPEEVHLHTDACYEIRALTGRQLTCGIKEHAHTDACYAKGGKLTAKAGDYVISVSFGPEALIPCDAVLSVGEVAGEELNAVEELVRPEREDGRCVALSRTFDVRILDRAGKQIQPAGDADIFVTFQLAEVADENLETRIYHIRGDEGMEAQELDVSTLNDKATVITDGFSYYTVEFTYGQLTYVLEGDNSVPLGRILKEVGLSGMAESVRISDERLLRITNEEGERIVTALRPFSTEEWIRVTIGEIEYEIALTDAVVQQGDVKDFAADAPLATIQVDYSKIYDDGNAVFTACQSGFSLVSEPETQYNYHILGCACYTGSIRMNADNAIPGDCFYYTFTDAAILPDGTRADVRITYSDVHIYTPPAGYQSRINGIPVNTMHYTGRTAVAMGRTVRCANENDIHIGLVVDVNIRIVRKDGAPVTGTFIYSMNDIDVRRGSGSNYANAYDAASHEYFSEQVQIVSGALSPAYAPAEGYKSLIADSGDLYANGVSFMPWTEDDDSYRSGFIVVANAYNGLTLHMTSSGGSFWGNSRNKVDSHLMTEYARQQILEIEKTWLDDDDSSGERPAGLRIGIVGIPQRVHFEVTGQEGNTEDIFTAAFFDADGRLLGAMVLGHGDEAPPAADLRDVRLITITPGGEYTFACHVEADTPNTLHLTAERNGSGDSNGQVLSEIQIEEGFYQPGPRLLSASAIEGWEKNGAHWQGRCEISPGWFDLHVYEEDLPQYESTDSAGNPAVPAGTKPDSKPAVKTGNNRYAVSFFNKKEEPPRPMLPYTGGSGVLPFRIAGLLVLAMAVVLRAAVYTRKASCRNEIVPTDV